jgi:hypothetical protein
MEQHFARWIGEQVGRGNCDCVALFEGFNAAHGAIISPCYTNLNGFMLQAEEVQQEVQQEGYEQEEVLQEGYEQERTGACQKEVLQKEGPMAK